ncbi:twin-arginine translocation pathway signal [Oxalobacteraceae bacterium OM1]|nr:twin-arginine translocation pathway signal [Oxalobacteraceae bacterium OM1]
MNRRKLILAAALGAVTAVAATGCGTTTTATTTTGHSAGALTSERRSQLDAGYDATLNRLYSSVSGSRELGAKARAILVFPSVIAAGLGIGGQYGEGVLRGPGAPRSYYNLASLSVGLQAGAQSKAIIFMFLTQEALDRFQSGGGWSGGVDASVAVVNVGANGTIDVNSVRAPVAAFVLTNAGLMANLTLEGTKITRIKE